MLSYLRALIVLHRTYSSLPAGARIHTLVRFLTCPFLRVLSRVPSGSTRLLEIGGGHGVFARLAAERGARSFVVEPDLRKLFAVGQRRGVRFIGAFDEAVRGEFDVIAIMDVLYAIPVELWQPLLERAAHRLRPGGVLLVKEMDSRSWKQTWNRFQETLSMRFLGITYAETFNYQSPEEFTKVLKAAGFATVDVVPVDRGYPHPHLLFVARRA